MARNKPKIEDSDLQLRSGEREHNRKVMAEIARRAKAKKKGKAASESSDKVEDNGTGK